jgi:hypothetical protein
MRLARSGCVRGNDSLGRLKRLSGGPGQSSSSTWYLVLSVLDAADSLQTVDGVGQCLRRVPLRDAEVSFGKGVI